MIEVKTKAGYALFFILILLIGLQYTNAATVSLDNATFRQLSAEDGLSQKTIPTIYQDRVGFIWIGTQDGLNRYDGRTFKTFKHSSSQNGSISHDYVYDITEDHMGNLLVATGGGLNRFNPSNETFTTLTLDKTSAKPIDKMSILYRDADGIVWVGTNKRGLYSVTYQSGKAVIKELDGFRQYDIRTILKDSRNRFWIGTERQGVIQLVTKNAKPKSITTQNSNLSHDRIRSIIEDHRGRVWIATRGGGVNRFNEISKQFKIYRQSNEANSLSHDRVYQIYQDSLFRLWFGTDGGISLYREESDDFTIAIHKASQKYSLSNNRIYSVIQDRKGLMWFGTLSGVNVWDPKLANFKHFRQVPEDRTTLSDNTVMSLAEKDSRSIYVGTFDKGLNLLDLDSDIVTPINLPEGSNERVMSLLLDSRKRLWVGGMSSGAEVFNESFERIKHYKNNPNDPNSISANGVTDIFEDSTGDIWVATYSGGVNRLSKTGKIVQYRAGARESLLVDNTYQIMEDDEGYIWVATDGGGIARIDRNSHTIKNITHDNDNKSSLSGNAAWSIFQDSKGRFWIGTQGFGLNRWEANDRRQLNNSFKHYSIDSGLNSSTVYGALEDDKGNIWLSTNKGVSRLDPETDDIQHFNLADEIHYNEFNQGAFLKSVNGQLIFGGLDGVSTFDPLQISIDKKVPNVVLTSVMSENKNIYFEKPAYALEEVNFDHNDYLIMFEFALLDFGQPAKNRYKYMLEGLDIDWIDLGNLNRATFTNLPAGTYKLKVMASNNDGVWSQESINLKVNVHPAPWLSWWAYASYGLSFCLIILLFIRLQAKRIASQELYRELVANEVNEKTILQTKNNEFLTHQIEQLKHQVNIDIQSGLPNQKFMLEVASFGIDWINFLGKKSNSTSRLIISLFHFPKKQIELMQTEKPFVEVIRKFNEWANANEKLVKVTRWGEHSIGILSMSALSKEHSKKINEWRNQLEIIVNERVHGSVSLNFYCVYLQVPLGGVQQYSLNGEQIMMLAEHMLILMSKQNKPQVLGITGTTQNIDRLKLKQILDATQIDEFSDVFVVEGNRYSSLPFINFA